MLLLGLTWQDVHTGTILSAQQMTTSSVTTHVNTQELDFDWCRCCPYIFFKMWISIARCSAVNGQYLKKRILLGVCSFLSFISSFLFFFFFNWLQLSFFYLWCILLYIHIFIFTKSLQMHTRSNTLLWKPYFCWLKLMVQVNANATEVMEISIVVAEIGPSWWLPHSYTLLEKPSSKLHFRSIMA